MFALDFAISPINEIAILGDLDHPHTEALIEIIWKKFSPNVLLAASNFPIDSNAPELFVS